MPNWKIQVRSNTNGQMHEEIIPAGNSNEAAAMAKARFPGWHLYNHPSVATPPMKHAQASRPTQSSYPSSFSSPVEKRNHNNPPQSPYVPTAADREMYRRHSEWLEANPWFMHSIYALIFTSLAASIFGVLGFIIVCIVIFTCYYMKNVRKQTEQEAYRKWLIESDPEYAAALKEEEVTKYSELEKNIIAQGLKWDGKNV